MKLQTGQRLGSCEIVAAIGAGGMGEVYRARDTKLNRDVAIKVLPDLFAADPERLARFTREAQTLAAVNHPNIAQIYGVVDLPPESGSHALVMEFADGEDLSALIARGAVPIPDALKIARQIGDALEAAHEQGIVHRDLKPANIKVRGDGTVKVLDFGLAKAMDPASSPNGGLMNSPTFTAHATVQGVILGTAAYMAPEQARGKAVDKRADIWAFGLVLFEMLTGRQTFAGDTISEVMAAVMKDDPDWSRLPAGLPPQVVRLLRRCLVKEPKQRLRDIGDARLLLDDTDDVRTTLPRSSGAARLAATILATAVIAGAATWLFTRPSNPAAPPLVQATITMPGDSGLVATGIESAIALSDTHVAFVAGATRQLFVRPLASAGATAVAGAITARMPVFSPDGQWLAFFSERERRLKKVAVAGGPTTDLAEDVDWPTGMDWGSAGIVFTDRLKGILTITAEGGAPRAILAPDKASLFMTPAWLPDGRSIVYTRAGRIGTADVELAQAKVLVLDLAAGAAPMAIADGYAARFVPPHSLVLMRENALVAMRFDPETHALSGGGDTLLTGVASAAYAVSASGTLAFQSAVVSQLTFVWVDRQNRIERTGIPPQSYTYPRISPDGSRIAIASRSEARDLWVWDLKQRALTRLTFEPGADSYPVWSPDGRSIIYAAAISSGDENLAIRAADGTGGLRVLLPSDRHQTPYSISPDGSSLVFRDEVPGHGTDLAVMRLSTKEVKPLIATTYNERNAEISPDGKLIAYQSDETGTTEIYVRSFPNVDEGKKQISNGGGFRPVWSRDGRRLFYMTATVPPAVIKSVERGPQGLLDLGSPETVFEAALYAGATQYGRTYDVAGDGRFLMPYPASDTPASVTAGVSLILNWAAHLPTSR